MTQTRGGESENIWRWFSKLFLATEKKNLKIIFLNFFGKTKIFAWDAKIYEVSIPVN